VLHPILRDRRRLFVYLLVWLAVGVLLAAVVVYGGKAPLAWAIEFAAPLAVLLGFVSLGSWYLVRALPAETTPPLRLLVTWATATALAVGLWIAAGLGWTQLLLRGVELSAARRTEILASTVPLLAAVGFLGFAGAVLVHYLLAAFARSREAERRALEAAVAAREAELRSLKAQLDPHFLFNSLNSVAALIGTDAPAARRMCFLMAGFFRKSLGLGRRELIPLAEEVYLAETFLAIEEVRFGERLRARFEVDEAALTLAVPPLLLQPLVENAVHHGIAHLVEGGEVRVAARRRGERLELEVDNPCDPDRPASRGSGIGLANVRARLEAAYRHRAAVEVEAEEQRFRVRLLLPAQPAVS
jgi:hypothetical protein